MVNMPNVLGMRLEDALAECRAQGVEPEIVMTLPPKGREQGTIRVIRAKEGVLTVSRFEDELVPRSAMKSRRCAAFPAEVCAFPF